MRKTKIEWADCTWNPVWGCKHGCPWCYARRYNNRFHIIPDFEDPQFIPNRIKRPYAVKKSKLVFVVAMGDLFGDWVKVEWRKEVFKVCNDNPQHTFIFLTKQPKNYRSPWNIKLPENGLYGTSISTNNDAGRLADLKRLYGYRKLFVSVEPILGPVNLNMDWCNVVLIGAMTGSKAVIPERSWVDNIRHSNIFYKNNIIKHFPDLPRGDKQQLL